MPQGPVKVLDRASRFAAVGNNALLVDGFDLLCGFVVIGHHGMLGVLCFVLRISGC